MPAQAGIHNPDLDPRFRGDDGAAPYLRDPVTL